ncbi:hypothetical protein CY34DRAFT_474335 [Suillus luteus UH-Slu-Lm8-n1]|uniref:Uncharacterized protein n=1 Tax=Suillus luteus UH-Slu-Lm8-n1 TaxID=930992 RepID=A0A0D0A6D6_9AGAM|nr:hypothetical protein CY34DRAFT_474335 [Suillus luteus UH-Slu-Lm8-n1]
MWRSTCTHVTKSFRRQGCGIIYGPICTTQCLHLSQLSIQISIGCLEESRRLLTALLQTVSEVNAVNVTYSCPWCVLICTGRSFFVKTITRIVLCIMHHGFIF